MLCGHKLSCCLVYRAQGEAMTPSRVKDLSEFPQNATLMESMEPQVLATVISIHEDIFMKHLMRRSHASLKRKLLQISSMPNSCWLRCQTMVLKSCTLATLISIFLETSSYKRNYHYDFIVWYNFI